MKLKENVSDQPELDDFVEKDGFKKNSNTIKKIGRIIIDHQQKF